jgi:hypothetical protein
MASTVYAQIAHARARRVLGYQGDRGSILLVTSPSRPPADGSSWQIFRGLRCRLFAGTVVSSTR